MFFYDTNLDLLTLAGSGSPKFLGVVIFETILQKNGEFRSKWAMGTSGSFKTVRTLASFFFFHRRDTENGQKCCFFPSHFSQLLQCENFQEVSRDAIWKVTSGRFRKCGGYANAMLSFFKPELWLLKVHGVKPIGPTLSEYRGKKHNIERVFISFWRRLFAKKNLEIWPDFEKQ